MHVVVLRDLLLPRRREHGQDGQSQHGGCHVRPPVPPQQIQADVPVCVDMFMPWRGLQEVYRGGLARVVNGESELSWERRRERTVGNERAIILKILSEKAQVQAYG